jgi:hypothetical protein
MRSRKRRIYVGCEGDAEYEYVRWLKQLIHASDRQVYLVPDNLEGGGLGEMARLAVASMRRMARDERFVRGFALLDTDRAAQQPQELAELQARLRGAAITVIWQDPCGEAFLLSHAWILTPGHRTRIENARDARRLFRAHFGSDRHLDAEQLARALPADLQRLRALDPMPVGMRDFLNAIGI